MLKFRCIDIFYGLGKKDEFFLILVGFFEKIRCCYTMLEDGTRLGRFKFSGCWS